MLIEDHCFHYIQGRNSGSYGRSVFNVSRTVVFFSVMTEWFYLPGNHVLFVVIITVTESKSSCVFRLAWNLELQHHFPQN